MASPRVVIIGMDGAEPDIIRDLIGRGELPNIKRVCDEGASGILTSTVPAISAPAWASFMTGTHPGKHGIFGFESRTSRSYIPNLVTSRDIHSRSLFELMSNGGKRMAAINVVMSYPPAEVNGVLISGFLAPMEALVRDFTYPQALAGDLLATGYQVEPEVLIYQSKKDYVNEVFKVMDKRAEVAADIFGQERWDFFMTVFTSVDRLQHRFWQDMTSASEGAGSGGGSPFSEAIFDSYRRCDRYIGEYLEKIDGDTTVILMSDHGFAGATRNFNIHNWLVEQNLLAVNLTRRKRLMLSNYRRIARWLGKTGLMKVVTVARARYPKLFRRMTGQFNFYGNIDWSRTRVYAIEKALHINVAGRDPEGLVRPGAEFDTLRDDLRDKLLALTDPETGERVVKDVSYGEETYSGPYAHLGGDIVFTLRPGFRHWPRLAPAEPVFTNETVFSSYHHDQQNGFLAVMGPGVKQTSEARQSIVDVAPTVMHILGLPLASEFDGRPMSELFAGDSEFNTRTVAVEGGSGARDRLKGRIRSLKSSGRLAKRTGEPVVPDEK